MNQAEILRSKIWIQMKQIKTDYYYSQMLIDCENTKNKLYQSFITLLGGATGFAIKFYLNVFLEDAIPFFLAFVGYLLSNTDKFKLSYFFMDKEKIQKLKESIAENSNQFDMIQSIFDSIKKDNSNYLRYNDKYTLINKDIFNTQQTISDIFGKINKPRNEKAKEKCIKYLSELYNIQDNTL